MDLLTMMVAGMFVIVGLLLLLNPRYMIKDAIETVRDSYLDPKSRTEFDLDSSTRPVRYGLLLYARLSGILLMGIGVWMILR